MFNLKISVKFNIVKTQGGIIMWIYLIIFAFILFLGVKIAPKGNFNEDFLSLKVSKGIQGFCAICIIAVS